MDKEVGKKLGCKSTEQIIRGRKEGIMKSVCVYHVILKTCNG